MREVQPFFSVVVPVYMVEDYLSECVNSVLDQVFRDFEIILIDDGSTDASGEICDSYLKEFPDVFKVVHTENRGLLLARRTGYTLAKGKYVISLDSDDLLREDALQIIHGIVEKSEADIVVFNASQEKGFTKRFIQFPWEDGIVFSGEGLKEVKRMLLTGTKLNNMCLKAISRDVLSIDKDYSRFKNVSQGEDILQSLDCFDLAHSVAYTSEILYYYRPNMKSITNTFNPNRWKSTYLVSMERLRFAQTWGAEFESLAADFFVNVFVQEARYFLVSNDRLNKKKQQLNALYESEYSSKAYALAKERPFSRNSVKCFMLHYLRGVVLLCMDFRRRLRTKHPQ